MGFFSDLKEDLSQAVNELIPEEEMASEKVENDEAVMSTDLDLPDETPEEMAEEASGDIFEDIPENMEEETSSEMSELEAMLERVDSIEISEDSNMAALEEMLEETPEEPEPIEEPEEEEIMIPVETQEVKNTNKTDWGGMKMDLQTRQVSDETAIITKGMVITGDIESEGSTEVIGTVNGNITILGKLNITGTINGNSQAEEIYADNAKITGEVKSEGAVKIGQSTVVIGNIFATSAVIAGAVKGDIDVKGPVVLDTSAIVMGNIKSKAVQINNGAVIEGMCSQCYADVNPTSFFESLNEK